MAITKIIRGDLIQMFKEGKFELIGHGANCQNVMGSGIAAQIHEQIPEAYEADAEFYEHMGGEDGQPCRNMAGQISVATIGEQRVVNMYTQVPMGRNADYQLLQRACQNLNRYCKGRSIRTVGLPMLGAGIGGLDAMAVVTIINSCTPDLDVVLVVYTTDSTMWKTLISKFINYGFPRKFTGLCVRTDIFNFSFYNKETEQWEDFSVGTLNDIRVINEGLDQAISFSDTDPAVYKLFLSKDAALAEK